MTEQVKLRRLMIVAVLILSITFSPVFIGTMAQANQIRTHHFVPLVGQSLSDWGIYMTAPNCGLLAAWNGMMSLLVPIPPYQTHFGFLAGYYAGLLALGSQGPCVNG